MAVLEPNYREGWLLRGQKLNEANARVAELEEALREMLDVSGSMHVVIDGPNAGWVGGADGYYDEDDVPSPDCAVCKAESAAKQVLEKGTDLEN